MQTPSETTTKLSQTSATASIEMTTATTTPSTTTNVNTTTSTPSFISTHTDTTTTPPPPTTIIQNTRTSTKQFSSITVNATTSLSTLQAPDTTLSRTNKESHTETTTNTNITSTGPQAAPTGAGDTTPIATAHTPTATFTTTKTSKQTTPISTLQAVVTPISSIKNTPTSQPRMTAWTLSTTDSLSNSPSAPSMTSAHVVETSLASSLAPVHSGCMESGNCIVMTLCTEAVHCHGGHVSPTGWAIGKTFVFFYFNHISEYDTNSHIMYPQKELYFSAMWVFSD